jgi:hypothetical protein
MCQEHARCRIFRVFLCFVPSETEKIQLIANLIKFLLLLRLSNKPLSINVFFFNYSLRVKNPAQAATIITLINRTRHTVVVVVHSV